MTIKQDARTICVKDIMTKSVVSIDAATTITDAAKLMEDAEIGAIVVTENNTPVGLITDRDFAIKVVAHAYQPTTPVKMIMSSPLYSISPDESVRMIADFMYTRGIRKLPVIDNDKVIGIVTATDLVRQFAMCTGDDLKKMYCESIARIYDHCSPYT
jgi:CBS domain-containing protein